MKNIIIFINLIGRITIFFGLIPFVIIYTILVEMKGVYDKEIDEI